MNMQRVQPWCSSPAQDLPRSTVPAHVPWPCGGTGQSLWTRQRPGQPHWETGHKQGTWDIHAHCPHTTLPPQLPSGLGPTQLSRDVLEVAQKPEQGLRHSPEQSSARARPRAARIPAPGRARRLLAPGWAERGPQSSPCSYWACSHRCRCRSCGRRSRLCRRSGSSRWCSGTWPRCGRGSSRTR